MAMGRHVATTKKPQPKKCLFDKNDLQIVQLFGELLSRKRKSICIAFLLFFTVYMVFLSVVLFSVYMPSLPAYHFPWGNFADFNPTHHLIHVHLLDGSNLNIQWGIDSSEHNRLPSYCRQAQWCYDWLGHSQLRANYTWVNDHVDCVSVSWVGTAAAASGAKASFVNCLHIGNSSGYWFGGIIRTDENWPIAFRDMPFATSLTGSCKWNGDSTIGIFEPSWFSSRGAALAVSRELPFDTNQTSDLLCFRSAKSANHLEYRVCRGQDVVDIVRSHKDHLSSSSSASPSASSNITSDWPAFGSVIVDVGSRGNVSENILAVCQTIRSLQLPMKTIYLIDQMDLFEKVDASGVARAMASCRNETTHAYLAAEFGCYVGIRDLEAGHVHVSMLVSQDNGSSIGAVQVHNSTCFLLDFTRWKVRRWYVNKVVQHALYPLVDLLAFYGGAASSLPVEASLNVTLNNLNLYSTAYADVVRAIPKGLMVDVAYGTQGLPLFVNIPSTLDNERNVIAMLLAASLQGYSMFVLELVTAISPDKPIDQAQQDKLRAWLQLAMVLPMFRVPATLIRQRIFSDNLKYYKPVRDHVVLPHYRLAYEQNRRHGDPVIRPIWWFAEHGTRKSLLTYNHQFMVGNDLVVAAFLHHQAVNYRLYLPPGRWTNPDTNITNDGGTVITLHIERKYNVVCFVRATEDVQARSRLL